MDAIIHLTAAERGFLMLRDDDGGLTVKAARNLDQQTLGSENFKFSRTITNEVLDSGKADCDHQRRWKTRVLPDQASIIGQVTPQHHGDAAASAGQGHRRGLCR